MESMIEHLLIGLCPFFGGLAFIWLSHLLMDMWGL